MASLFIKDSETAALVDRLAKRQRTTKTEAVKRAVLAALGLQPERRTKRSARLYLADFDRRFPIPEKSGRKADKAFYDDLSGDL